MQHQNDNATFMTVKEFAGKNGNPAFAMGANGEICGVFFGEKIAKFANTIKDTTDYSEFAAEPHSFQIAELTATIDGKQVEYYRICKAGNGLTRGAEIAL